MADMLQTGLAWLGATMDSYAATAVEYIPANHTGSTLAVMATISATQKVTDSGEVIVTYHTLDFSFLASYLQVDEIQLYPQAGDVINATTGSFGGAFEVRRDPGNREVWDWTDSSKTRFRVHAHRRGASA